MRISDWSSDVCSSDLLVDTGRGISAMDFPAFDIDPVETLFLCAPARRFAEQGAGVEEELDHIRGLAPAVAAASIAMLFVAPDLFLVTPDRVGAYRFRIRHPVIASGAKQSRVRANRSGLLR